MGKYKLVDQSYIQIGDVLLYQKDALISEIIDIFERSKFGHAGLTDRITNDIWVYEAIQPQFVRRTLRESIGSDSLHIIIKRPKFPFDKELLINTIDTLRGHGYDYQSIFSQLIHKTIGGWPGTKDVDKVYCSEAVLWAFNQLTNLFPEWYSSSPDDIAENETDFEQAVELDIKNIKF